MITVNKANPTPGEITSSLTGFSGDGGGLNLANNGYIDVANNAATEFSTTDFTIEFVLNQTADNVSDNYIYFSHIGGNSRVIIWNDISADVINVRFTNSSGLNFDAVLSYDMSADYGTPTHYVFAFDRSADLTLYKNGNSVASVSISSYSSINIGAGNANVSRIGSGTNYGALGTFYRFRAFKTLADAKLLFERADVPQTLTANLLYDLDLAFANPTQSFTVQDRKGNSDATASSSTAVTQVQPVVQLNSTSARIGTTAATPADGAIISDTLGVGVAPVNKLSVEGYNTTTTVGTDVDVHIEGGGAANHLTQLGFGYNAQNTSWKPPVIIGSKTVNASGQTEADFFVATRSGTTGTDAPATRLTIDASGNVMIGSGTAGRLLELSNASNPALRLNNGNSVADIGIASSAGALLTGAADDDLVIARNGAYGISVGTDGTTRLSINSTGQVQIQQSASDQSGASALKVTGTAYGTNKTIEAYMNTSSSTKSLIYAENSSGGVFNVRGDGLATFNNGIAFTQTNTSATGATATGTTLSHYEQGTFSPTDGSGAGLTFSSVSCNYTRVGRVVVLTGSFTFPTTSSSAQARVTVGTLPFSANGNSAGAITIATVSGGGGIDSAGYIRKEDNSVFQNSELSGGSLYFNTTYIV